MEMNEEKPARCSECLKLLTEKEKEKGEVCDICRSPLRGY
jgi:uncharacterized CHY-type Zn-finger protein